MLLTSCVGEERDLRNFYVWLNVHFSIILVTDQLNEKNSCFIIRLLYPCTCFEHYCAHHEEVKIVFIQHLVSHTVGGRPVHRTATYRV